MLVSLGIAFYLVSVVGPSWSRSITTRSSVRGLPLRGGPVDLRLEADADPRLPARVPRGVRLTYTDRIIGFTQQLQDVGLGGYVLLVSPGFPDIGASTSTPPTGDGSPDHESLNIAEACSGMRMLVAFMATPC